MHPENSDIDLYSENHPTY